VPHPADLERVLRAAGVRVTRPRLAVPDAVHAHLHVDPETLTGATRTRPGAVSHQVAHDVLRTLTDSGLVRRIQPQGSVARHEDRFGDDHHHLVCRSCGTIADVDCATGAAPCLTPSDDGPAVIDEAEVVHRGASRPARPTSRPRDPTAPQHREGHRDAKRGRGRRPRTGGAVGRRGVGPGYLVADEELVAG
jgi:Fur family ferric uptake transcriptional regulator